VSTIVYSGADVDDVFSRDALLTAAMLAGIAESTPDQAVEYAKARVQFGQPIGVYQAVKRPRADMAIRAEGAAFQLFFATLAFEAARPDAAFQVSAAKVVAANPAPAV
jgi:alkylation response protein AidB-like acyl-CoA dehydrogenase